MDKRLVNSIIRVCQSEYVRHYPNDRLLGYLESHAIGGWSGDTYRISPEDKKILADRLMSEAGVDAFSPEVGGTFMMGKAAHLTAQLETLEVSEPRLVLIKGFNTSAIHLGAIEAKLPEGSSLSIPFDLASSQGLHQCVILCQHYEVFSEIHTTSLNFEDIGFNPLVVFYGASPTQRDTATRFLTKLGLPVHCALDYSPDGLRIALDVPFFGSFLTPASETMTALIARHNKADMFYSQSSRLVNHFHDTQGQIKVLWDRLNADKICLSSKAFLPTAITDAPTATQMASDDHTVDVGSLAILLSSPTQFKQENAKKKKENMLRVTPEELAKYKSVHDEKTQTVLEEKNRSRSKEDKGQAEVQSFRQYTLDK